MSDAARDRATVLTSLALLIALAWGYLWLDAQTMEHMATPGMALLDAFAFGFAMWAVMMVGMMLPSAAPMTLFYAALVRKSRSRGSVLPSVWTFAAGYLAVWTGFSLAAALLQAGLLGAMLITPMGVSASKSLSAAILVAAGVYQWLPLKNVCLRNCRHPIEFFAMRWRAGALGAWRMGLEHGLYCLGCCWLLMMVLFVAGAMDLLWVAAIAAFVFVEKLLPGARYTSRLAGLALVAWGVAVLAR